MTERLDHFMARANAAYYATHNPFADFTTAPEISQVFGELLGLWAAVTWRSLGAPTPVSLVELGPGRGTLMADASRAIARAAPEFHTAAEIHLVETSPRLRTEQRGRICRAEWHDAIDTVPDGPLILLANEFLDALPIRQFVRRGAGWTERHVVRDGFVEEPTSVIPEIDAREGEVIERGEAAEAIASAVATRLVRHPGAALFLDYGPERSAAGDSLQAIAQGQPADPLGPVGTADLTAHVDFARFADGARGESIRPRAGAPGVIPRATGFVSADQPAGAETVAGQGGGDDGRRAPAGRAGSHGPAVQSNRTDVLERRCAPRLRDAIVWSLIRVGRTPHIATQHSAREGTII
jgi:NADH dehydrogenase [ubiquinone] 1 alpha subcomplex assembly factor 7